MKLRSTLRQLTQASEMLLLGLVEPFTGKYRPIVRAYRRGLWMQIWFDTGYDWFEEEGQL